MNYLILLTWLLILTTIVHCYVFSMRFIRIAATLLPSNRVTSSNITIDTSCHIKDRNLQALLTFIFATSPFVLNKCLSNIPFNNSIFNYFFMGIIVIISIFGLWFSIVKLKVMNGKSTSIVQKTFTPIASTTILTKIGRKSSIAEDSIIRKIGNKKSREDIVLRSQFIKFLNVVAGYELYDKDKFYFHLGGYKIQEKGRTITRAQACFILTFFWYHEVLKTNDYTDKVQEIIWECWSSYLKINAPLNKDNWGTFKGKYLHRKDDQKKYLDLKESSFYISFKEYYTKNQQLAN